MKSFLFPGQGSQRKGMGKDLFHRYPAMLASAADVLGYDVAALCIDDPQQLLNETQYTQPALYIVNVLSYLDSTTSAPPPDVVLGHSLGEYAALFAAGAFSFEAGLRLVKKRAEIMADVKNGGMLALVGLDLQTVRDILKRYELNGIDIANYNSSLQIVLSGMQDDIQKARQVFEVNGARLAFPLNVSGAFHSRYMKEAAAGFGAFVRTFEFSPLQIPVLSNASADWYTNESIADLLEQQISNPVRWYESISRLMHLGDLTFHETGPGEVLTKMLSFIKDAPMPDLLPLTLPTPAKAINGHQDAAARSTRIKPEALGAAAFREDYNLKYAYVAGAMSHGIASAELVVRMGQAGMMGYFGSGGLKKEQTEKAIIYIQEKLKTGESYGMNLLNGSREEETADLILKYKIRNIEAAAYMEISPVLARLRLHGVSRRENGTIHIPGRLLAKVSRPEVATAFLSPPPERIVKKLLQENLITPEEAALAPHIPMADDICVEADSGGHTDMGVAFTLIPTIMRLRDEAMKTYCYSRPIRIGAAGGIGTPEAAAAAFILGADFILTGSINQCTVESGASDLVKDMLQEVNEQDTVYAPAGDMFEMGARVQVLKKGVLFPARAQKLYDLYRQHNSLDEIDEKTKTQLQEKYFKQSFHDAYKEVETYYARKNIQMAEATSKQKMAYLFRWYFGFSIRAALHGDEKNKVDFQVNCGPALGAFNQWAKHTAVASWRNRHVDAIGEMIMNGAAGILDTRLAHFGGGLAY
jgi:trans-AT polyketide synthase/acyltransferase/oxidoreductase domain-containing protein